MKFLSYILGYSQLHFCEELARQLAGIDEEEEVPLYKATTKFPTERNFSCNHLPEFDDENRRNCRVCYITEKVERKTSCFLEMRTVLSKKLIFVIEFNGLRK